MATLSQTRRASTGLLRFRLFALLFAVAAFSPQLYAQTFQILSATPSFIPANANGATLILNGKLPSFPTNLYQICVYTGYGSTAPISPSPAAGPTIITVPASIIQGVPASQFTAANGYAFPAQIYIVPTGTTCTGSFDPTLTNSFAEPIAESLLSSYSGPTTIPQTNPATSVQAPPINIVLTGSSFATNTVVNFGSFGAITPKILSPSALSVAVPPAFSASPVGTTAAITLCNTGGLCGTGTPLTLTITALTPSLGKLTVTPTPVTIPGTTTLTAQFKKDPASTGLPEPGVPSGVVTFVAGGETISTAPLTLDTTAVLVPQTTTTTIATTAAPVFSPAAGTYATAQKVSITDTTPGAAIYYTTDGSKPNPNSQLYTGAINVAATETITAIAIAAGSLPSTPAANLYTIFVPVPTSLAFVAQPVTSPTNTTITPAVTVAVLDQLGNTITTSTAPVSIAIGTNPGSGTLTGTLTVNAVNGIATFSDLSIDNIANGYTLAASSAGLTSATSTAFNITPYPITVKLFDPLIGVTSTLPGTFTLGHPAPSPNGVLVTLTSSPTSNVTVSPATVNVPAGATTGSFTYTGVATGPATISASATGYLTGSATVTATNSLVSLGTIPSVAPGQTVDLALSIATNAPAGGVTVNFTSSNTGVATITPSVFIPAGQRTAAANPQITGVTIGTTQVNATAQGYAPDTRAVNVTVVANFSTNNINIPRATVSTVTLNISAPAQTGGLTFTLTSTNTNKVTVPASVTIPQGQTSVVVPVTGVADGNSIPIHADSPGVTEASLTVNVSSQLTFYYGNQTIGVNMQVANYINLPTTPAAPVTITLSTSNGATIAAISNSGTVVGVGTTLTFPNITTAGPVVAYWVQGQAVGNTTLTVSASSEFTGTTSTVTVYPSGFTFRSDFSSGLNTTTFSSPTTFNVYPSVLNPGTLTYYAIGTLSPGVGPISVPVTSSNTATGTITTSPVIFNAGDSYNSTTFQPGTAGTSTIAIGTPTGGAGFSTPTTNTQITATVTAPQLNFSNPNQIAGVNMQVTNYVSFPVAPPSPVTVTVSTSNGATIAAISKSGTVVGVGTTLTFTNVTGVGNVVQFWVQGQAVGTTTVTATATGYTSASTTINVYPSGFTFLSSYSSGLPTTTFSAPTILNVYPTILSPGTLTEYTTGILSPGVGPISVPVTSSNTATGTITTSPLTFNAGGGPQTTNFQPAGAGTSTIAIGTPTGAAGFSTPSNYVQIAATVTAPQLSFNNPNQITGVNMQATNYVNFPVAAPSPVTVTVSTSNGATIAALSKSGTVVGVGTTLTFTNVTGSGAVAQFFIQGQAVGTTTLTATATGYTSVSTTVSVYPSGFTFLSSYSTGLPTTTFSTPTNISVYPTILNPGTLTEYTTGTLSPGIGPITVPVTSSNTVVGTISTSPLTFNAGDGPKTTNFQPAGAGTSTIAIGASTGAAGFSTPSQYTQITATVSAPQVGFNSSTQTTGVNIQQINYVSLPVAPPNPVTITVTSNGPGLVLLSKSSTTVGTSSITFTNVTGAGSLSQFYVQGQSVGSTTLTVSAPGYTSSTAAITVNPSGFTFDNSYSSGLTTTTTSSPTQLNIYPTILNTGTLTVYGVGGTLNPGLGGVSVPITSSNTSVGTITTSPLIFGDGASSMVTKFQPSTTGSTTITIGVPATPGFSTPSQSQTINATVQ